MILITTGDCNDGDYITKVTEVNPDIVARIQRIYGSLKDNVDSSYGIPWTSGARREWDGDTYEKYEGFLSEEDKDFFNQYLPHGEYGIHTIKSIQVSKGPLVTL